MPDTTIARDETIQLIASDKVEGTAVYSRHGERLGTVSNFMVDKRSGQAVYAVMSFGGFLGIGESYHPIPWRKLKYDTAQGGYIVDIDPTLLEGAPAYNRDELPDWNNRDYGSRIDKYYGLEPYTFTA